MLLLLLLLLLAFGLISRCAHYKYFKFNARRGHFLILLQILKILKFPSLDFSQFYIIYELCMWSERNEYKLQIWPSGSEKERERGEKRSRGWLWILPIIRRINCVFIEFNESVAHIYTKFFINISWIKIWNFLFERQNGI